MNKEEEDILHNILSRNNIDYSEYLILKACNNIKDFKEYEKSLIEKGYLKDIHNKLVVSIKVKKIVDKIKLSFNYVKIKRKRDMERSKESEYFDLALKLQELYPSGRRPGSSVQWRSNKFVLARKLKMVHDDFGVEFTDEQAINAVKRYVESFNNNFTYMECLEYFILRLRPEFKSNFISYLENADADDDNTEDFNTKVR